MFAKFKKAAYVISACIVAAGTQVTNFLEQVTYTTDAVKCVVLTGTAGEEWVADIAKVCKTYTAIDGSPLTPERLASMAGAGQFEVRTRADGPVIWAKRIPVDEQVDVATSWGDILHANAAGVPHGDGDYIVAADRDGAPDPNDQWVVNGVIFGDTYVAL